MPLCVFVCEDCENRREHFIYNLDAKPLCPKCQSEKYVRTGLSKFRANSEFRDRQKWLETKVNPHVNEVYEKIGKEALDFDTKTAENMFGEEKVANTFVPHDEA
jgi:predicted patatin/cPLA2 family phospholipase